MKHQLFPQKPEDLAAVSPDELRGLLTEIGTVAASIRAGECDLTELGDTDEERATEVVAQMQAAKETKAAIKEHLAALEEAAGNFVEDVSALAADLEDEPEAEPVAEPSATLAAESEPAPDEPAPDEPAPDEPAPDEPASDEPAAQLAAEVAPEPRRQYAIPAGAREFTPPQIDSGPSAPRVRALDGVEMLNGRTLKVGEELDRVSFMEAALAMARRQGPVVKKENGGEQRYSLATRSVSFDEEWRLHAGDAEGNLRKLLAMGTPFLGPDGMDALVAAGGICAPPTPYYDPPGFASRSRPVADSLPTLAAPRGGVSIPSVNIVDRSDSGVTVIEEDEDAAGGTFAVKACRTVSCATWTDTFVGIISHCLEVGNLNAITWPEGVALESDNLMAGWAATADTRLLNRLKALSIRVTDNEGYNAVHRIVYSVMRAKASIQNNLRADDGLSYTAVMPRWILNLLVSDMAAQSAYEQRYVAESQIRDLLGQHNIRVFFYLDTPTTDESQLMPAEVTGTTLDKFPTVAQWGIWINGQFARLDTGDLELGMVRDSDLNSINQYQLFGESFENVAKIGPDQGARWVRSTICPNGVFPALATAITC